MTIIMIVAGFLFCSVSAYMAGLVGSSNNPVSGITICTILFASLVLMLLMGRDAALGPVAAIMIGAVVCCAACIGGDNLQDLKCGYIVGATPWKQQVMLAIGAASSAPRDGAGAEPAAQGLRHRRADRRASESAARAAGDADGFGRQGHVRRPPALGHDLDRRVDRRRRSSPGDEWLKRARREFRAPVLAVAVGIYLPLELSVPIFLGGLIAHLVERRLGIGGDAAGGARRSRTACCSPPA